MDSPPNPKQIKWPFAEKKAGVLPESNMMTWASKLKSTKNPFLAPNPVQENNVKSTLPYAALGAISTAAFNAMVTDKLPAKYHLPAHGGLALASLLLPKHSLSAAVGGSLFYAAISETVYKIIKSNLLGSLKNATK